VNLLEEKVGTAVAIRNIQAASRRSPWYSTRIGETVHHDNTLCPEGSNVELYYLRRGTGGLPLCKHCARLDQEGR
jgi:hypothetical protein